MHYKGSCHCGDIVFQVEADPGPVIDCNCSHCSRKGYLLWFVARDKLKLVNTSESQLSTYTFNKHVIKHHFCPTCGCAPFGFGTNPSGAPMAAVNVRCLEGIDLAKLERTPFNGKSR